MEKALKIADFNEKRTKVMCVLYGIIFIILAFIEASEGLLVYDIVGEGALAFIVMILAGAIFISALYSINMVLTSMLRALVAIRKGQLENKETK